MVRDRIEAAENIDPKCMKAGRSSTTISGDQFVATGSPEAVARLEDSHTGRYLRDLLPTVDLEGPRGERVEPVSAPMDDD